MAKRTIQGSRVIVTGASSGIGREIARRLAGRGARLLVTARRQDRLEELAGELDSPDRPVRFLAGDIADPDHRARLIDTAQTELGGLDILVNNAGVGALGPFAEAGQQRLRHVMEVNFFAPVELIRNAIPLLRTGRRSMIVNVSSVLGHRAVPGKSEYCASKFALHGFSDALRAELSKEGIDVLLVSPSTTRSEFFESVLKADSMPRQTKTAGMPAAKVARKTVRAIERGKHEIILSPGGKAFVWLDRLCPTLADWLTARYG